MKELIHSSETYTTIPPTWKLVNEDKGITINTDTEISTDAQSLSDLLANLTGISNAVTEQVGKDIPLRLLENGKKIILWYLRTDR